MSVIKACIGVLLKQSFNAENLMSVAMRSGARRYATLIALCLLVPGTAAWAQHGALTLRPLKVTFDGKLERATESAAPVQLRLRIPPDFAAYAGTLPRLALSAGNVASIPSPAGPTTPLADAVTCPMPVARRDSSAVPTMPRHDPPVGDRGGVTVPSCRNPLDTP